MIDGRRPQLEDTTSRSIVGHEGKENRSEYPSQVQKFGQSTLSVHIELTLCIVGWHPSNLTLTKP